MPRTLPSRATYEDYLQLSDDGRRYEILDGEIYVAPTPSTRHQYASFQLQKILADYFDHPAAHLVLAAPFTVRLADDDVVEPDLVVVARGPQLSEHGVDGPPLLIVEILSPGRPAYDRKLKARRYQVRHVANYWIVDPQARTLECFRLVGDAYELEASGADAEPLRVSSFEGLEIPLGQLWLD